MKNKIFVVLLCMAPFWVFSQRFSHGDLQVPTPSHARRGFITLEETGPLGPVAHKPVIDLQPQLPKAGMQGQQGSCAAWATCYGLVSFLQSKMHNWSYSSGDGTLNPAHVYSPSYLYNQLNQDATCQSGLLLDTVMAKLQTMGTVPLADFGYIDTDCSSQPTSTNETHKVTIMDGTTLFNWWASDDSTAVIDTAQVKDVLNQGYPVVVGVHIDTTFERLFTEYGEPAGPYYIWNTFIDSPLCRWYHAMLCVGYDDGKRAFKLMNSWDTDFANQGFIYVDYQQFVNTTLEAYYSTLLPAGINLVSAKTKETRKGPNNQLTTNESGIVADSWVQPGTFRTVGDYELSCLYADKSTQRAMLQIRDVANNRFTRTLLDKNSTSVKKFLHNGKEIKLTLDRVSVLSRQDGATTAFFTLQVSVPSK